MRSGTIAEPGNGKITDHFSQVVDLMQAPTTSDTKITEQGIGAPVKVISGDTLQIDYHFAVRQLVDLYCGIENLSLSLPAFSALPFGVFFCSIVKFESAVLGDLFLFIPINCVVFLRNILPGRWAYKSWSWKYFRYIFFYLWHGDWYPSTIFVRSLTMFLLSSHFRGRLFAIRRRLLLDRKFGETKEEILSEIDSGLKLWESPTAITMVFTYILPTVGPVMALWGRFVPSDLTPWAKYIAYLSMSYALAILVTAFIVKRGLMLGGTGRSAYFPGALEQPTAHVEERDILDMFGLPIKLKQVAQP
jgi:hypothetical protein